MFDFLFKKKNENKIITREDLCRKKKEHEERMRKEKEIEEEDYIENIKYQLINFVPVKENSSIDFSLYSYHAYSRGNYTTKYIADVDKAIKTIKDVVRLVMPDIPFKTKLLNEKLSSIRTLRITFDLNCGE